MGMAAPLLGGLFGGGGGGEKAAPSGSAGGDIAGMLTGLAGGMLSGMGGQAPAQDNKANFPGAIASTLSGQPIRLPEQQAQALDKLHSDQQAVNVSNVIDPQIQLLKEQMLSWGKQIQQSNTAELEKVKKLLDERKIQIDATAEHRRILQDDERWRVLNAKIDCLQKLVRREQARRSRGADMRRW